MKQIAIIGSTASGKTNLSIEIALKTNSVILSLDSLCVYKEIDIVSAKPSLMERKNIIHFGIDEVYPNETFDVIHFINLYKKAKDYALKNNNNLIIVGGTGFYLKSLVDGISFGLEEKIKLDISIQGAYELLCDIDKVYMNKIEKNDKYRIEKAYNIYKKTNLSPSEYFKQNPKISYTKDIKIFEIFCNKEDLKSKVNLRTNQMLQDGLIDEVIYLEKKYTRSPNCMSSIGISETLQYLDAKISKEELKEKIIQNTMKLAKRQNTFNKSQFLNKTINTKADLNSDILKYISIKSQA